MVLINITRTIGNTRKTITISPVNSKFILTFPLYTEISLPCMCTTVLKLSTLCFLKTKFAKKSEFLWQQRYVYSIVVLERQQHCIHNKQANKSLTHRLKWKFSYKVANSEIVINFILGMVFLLKNIELVSRSSTAIN